ALGLGVALALHPARRPANSTAANLRYTIGFSSSSVVARGGWGSVRAERRRTPMVSGARIEHRTVLDTFISLP
ncbi:MAG: hypothetical protein ACYDCI_09605, partial [Candidatus Limnocylindrales bacterium]